MDASDEAEFTRLLKAFQIAQAKGDVEQIEALSAQCLMFAAEEAARHPSERLRLLQVAETHENAARWEEAEAVYRQLIKLAETEGNEPVISAAHRDLSDLYLLRGMVDQALLEAQSALAALSEQTDLPPLRLITLQSLFRCQWICGDLAGASATADEAMQIPATEKTHGKPQVRALLMRAQCRVHRRELAKAADDLNLAWEILSPLAEAKMLAGNQACLAFWWEITARVRTQLKDLAGAAEAMGQAVEFRRNVSQAPQLNGPYKYQALAKILQEYSVALAAAGEFDAATRAFDESGEIQETIQIKIPPPARIQ